VSTEPSREQLTHATDAVRKALYNRDARHNRNAAHLLSRYYDPTSDYAGSTFLDLTPNHPHDVTATDLYALSLLDVRAKPLAGRRLLEPGGHRVAVINALSSDDLPESADLLTASDDTYEAAEKLYLAVRDALGRKPWVTASKLCARKRPHFFPVRDSVVTELVLGLGKSYLIDWQVYRHLLVDQEVMGELGAVTAQAAELSDRPDGIPDPPLRILDVLLWMTAPADLRRRRRRA
jgi:hypothetical protein